MSSAKFFDRPYQDAGLTSPPSSGVQAVTVPPGGATGVEIKIARAGRFTLVDHALSRFERGLARYLNVDGRATTRSFERKICALHEHAVSLGRKTAEERVCSLLMSVAGEAQGRLQSGVPSRVAPSQAASSRVACRTLDVPMTRGEIGDYLGLSLETVCRILSDLQHQVIIEIGCKQGEVDVRSLRRLCGAARHKEA